MLDFYLLYDDDKNPVNGTGETDYLGGIDWSEFNQLQEANVIKSCYTYFEDFRWTSEQVNLALIALGKLNSSNFLLASILQRAQEKGAGIIANSD